MKKNGVICLVSMFPSLVMVLKLSKKCIFCNFVLTSARNLSLLKRFTYMPLKVFITHFQKMIWFIGVNMKTREMIPFFFIYFSALTVCNIHFWIWKYSKFIFTWSPLWSILVCKIPQFLVKGYRFVQLIILSR